MLISRERAVTVNRILDDAVPAWLRDRRWFMAPLAWLLFRDKARVFLDFKDSAFTMSPEEFAQAYRDVAEVSSMQGDTDLNDRCLDAILDDVVGKSVLDAGCGRGLLAQRLAERWETTACDIAPSPTSPDPGFQLIEASVESLPFADGSFDTVVCTHTLEHVQRFSLALSELRRVARRRLIVVVPRQRPYRYTFNLHLHFFPYAWSIQAAIGNGKLTDLGDWYYVEEVLAPGAA